MVSKIASANIESLAREHNPQDLEDRLAYDAKMEELRQLVTKLNEMISETQLANSVDIMSYVDAYSENLQTSRRDNGSLDLAMREVDEWNKPDVQEMTQLKKPMTKKASCRKNVAAPNTRPPMSATSKA